MTNSRIVAYWHCRNCMPAKPVSISPADWSRVETGWTPEGIQCWCRRCDKQVVTMNVGAALQACLKVLQMYSTFDKITPEQFGEHTKEVLLLAQQAIQDEIASKEGVE